MDCNKGFVKNMILTAQNDDAGRRLDRILRKALPHYPLSAIHRILRKGQVLVNGRSGKGEDRIPAGALIELPINENETQVNYEKSARNKQPAFKPAKLDILWEGTGLLILNKPAGLAIHGGNGCSDNLAEQVQEYLKGKLPPSLSFKPGPLHRLDKPTSGIVVFGLNLEAAQWFSRLLRERKIRKRYLAILQGTIEKSESWEENLTRDKNTQKTLISSGDQGRFSKTGIEPLARTKKNGVDYTLARLEIVTGRTHQIRAQAAFHGHPLAGDRKYGNPSKKSSMGKGSYPDKRVGLDKGFFLHAAELELPDEQRIYSEIPAIIKAPLPEKFVIAIKEFFDLTI